MWTFTRKWCISKTVTYRTRIYKTTIKNCTIRTNPTNSTPITIIFNYGFNIQFWASSTSNLYNWTITNTIWWNATVNKVTVCTRTISTHPTNSTPITITRYTSTIIDIRIIHTCRNRWRNITVNKTTIIYLSIRPTPINGTAITMNINKISCINIRNRTTISRSIMESIIIINSWTKRIINIGIYKTTIIQITILTTPIYRTSIEICTIEWIVMHTIMPTNTPT